MDEYRIGSEPITFSADARPQALAGTTAERWFITDAHGRRLVSYLLTEDEAQERVMGLRIDEFLTAVV